LWILTDSLFIQHGQLDEFAFVEGLELSHVVVKVMKQENGAQILYYLQLKMLKYWPQPGQHWRKDQIPQGLIRLQVNRRALENQFRLRNGGQGRPTITIVRRRFPQNKGSVAHNTLLSRNSPIEAPSC
jgi:hypothetical protein